jgi:spermidine synthase
LSKLWLERGLVFSSWESGAVFSLGFSAVAAEVVLLLAFQAACGALYWKLGILMAAFMGGLALGALVGVLKPLGALWSRRTLRLVLVVAGLAALLGSTRLGSLMGLGPGSAVLMFCGLLTGTGFLVGWSFPLACSTAPAAVYAADLCGAALGAFLAAAFLVPLVGMAGTLAVAGAAVLPAALWPFDIIGAMTEPKRGNGRVHRRGRRP